MQSPPESSFRMKNFIVLRYSEGQIKDQKGLSCSYQPLFQDQVLQRSVRIHRSHLICHTTDCSQRETGYKEPRTRTQRPRTGHKIIAAVESPQLMGWECHSQHTFDASARSLCSIAEQTSGYVFTHLTGRSTTLTDSSIHQLHKKCNSKPS